MKTLYVPKGETFEYERLYVPSAARRKGCVHQRHEAGAVQRAGGSRLRRWEVPLPLCPAGVGRLLRIGGDGPGLPKFLRAGDAPGSAELLYHPNRDIPFLGSFPYREVFHIQPP